MKRVLTAVVAAALLLVGGCSGDDQPTASPTGGASAGAAAYPVTVGKLTLAARPERIVSLAPTATEMLFAIGAGPQVTVLATMHDLSIAGEYADRMVLLAAGRVVAAGPPRTVLTQDNLATHYRVRVRVIDGEHGPLVVPVRGH